MKFILKSKKTAQTKQPKTPTFQLLFQVTKTFFSIKPTKLINPILNVFWVILILSICSTIRFTPATFGPLKISILCGLSFLLLVNIVAIWKQPQNKTIDTFKVPLFPFIPLIGIAINIYLVLTLKPMTWIRFSIWFLIGLIFYFCFGIRNSKERIVVSDLNVNRLNIKHESDWKKESTKM